MESQPTPKSDRNDLEYFLWVKLPELLKRQANNILLVVTLIAAAIFFWNFRASTQAQADSINRQNAAIAFSQSGRAVEMLASSVSSETAVQDRQSISLNVLRAAEAVINNDSASGADKATALLARADTLFALSQTPARALSTTRPVVGFEAKSSSDYLAAAETDFTAILRDHTDRKEIVASALLGMAAVAETRLSLEDAAGWYEKVINDKSLQGVYHEIAASRLKMLADLKTMPALAPTTSPTTTPTTSPAASPTPQP